MLDRIVYFAARTSRYIILRMGSLVFREGGTRFVDPTRTRNRAERDRCTEMVAFRASEREALRRLRNGSYIYIMIDNRKK